MAQNITLKNNSRAYKSLIDLKDKYTTPGRTGVNKNSTAYEKLGELRKKYYTDKVSADDVKKWFSSVAPAIEEMSKYNEQFKDTYTTDYGGELSTKIKDLMNQSGDVYAYLQNHKGDYENFGDLAKTFYDYRAALEDYDVNNYKQNRYYSKFDNEDQYNWYKSIDSNYINSYIEDVNKYSSAPMESKYDVWNDSDIASKTDSLRTWLRLSQNSLDADTYKSFNDTLESMSNVGKELSGFTDSADYANWYKNDYPLLSADVGALRQEVAQYNDDYDIIWELSYTNMPYEKKYALQDGYTEAQYNDVEQKRNYISQKYDVDLSDIYGNVQIYGELMNRLDDEMAQKQKLANLAERSQNLVNLTNNALNSKDFNEYFERGRSDVKNLVMNVADDLLQMTDQETQIYNYYYAKDKENGTNYAMKYMEAIQEGLNKRIGSEIGKKIDNTALEYLASAAAGVDQFAGIKGLFNGDKVSPISIAQYTREYVAENNKGLFKVSNDLVNTLSNMAPSIAAGMVSPAIGTGLLAASAAGNAKADFLRQGYTEKQANSYALLVGASEAALSKVLSGIGPLGGGKGIFQSIAGKIMPHLNKAVWRVAVDVGANMLDEGLEESIQEVLDPVFKVMATGEDFEGIDIENVLYSGLLGVLSGGIVEGAPKIKNTVSQSKNAKNLYGADAQALVGKALDINPDNLHAQAMQKQLDSGKKLSGYQLNRLAQENDSAIAAKENSDLKSATIDRLYELGEKSNTDALSDIIVKAKSGEKLSKSERSTLVHSKYGQLVLNEIKTGKLGASNAGENTTAKQDAAGGKFEASRAASKGNIKTPVKEIASVKDGVITLRLDDGSVVNANEVSLDSKTSSLYEKVAEMNLNSASANLFVDNYDGKSSVSEYAHDFSQAYRYGELGVPKSEMFSGKLSSTLTEKQMDVAYELGKMDAKYKIFDENKTANDKNNLKYSSNSDIIKNNKSEVISNESTNGLYLRDGGERIDGENTEGSVFDLESGTRAYTQRRKSGRVADSEAARLAYEGREVSVASTGILHGSANHTVRMLDGVEETANMKLAHEEADKRGLKLRFFAGGNLVIADKDGKLFSARAYILGDMMLVRADHPFYTSEQLVRHEIGHDMIAKGEVNPDAVRKRLKEIVDDSGADSIAAVYAEAYKGTNLTPEEIWEECICDALGDMNIFTSNETVFEFMSTALKDVKEATLSTAKSPTQTRGSPEGKASYAGKLAETANLSALDRAEQMIADGVDPETVRKETGWFKGYDGEWRFEIDDSQAEWNLDSAKPDPKRLFEFGERIFKLTDLLNHPDLYKAYPQLKKVTVWENPYASTGGYVVGKNTETFTVKSLADTNINKDILIHEIQHLIQNIEGFSTGASVDQFEYKAWGEKEYAAYEKRNEIASKLYAILRRHGVSITKSDIASVRTDLEVRDGIIDYNWMRINSLADINPRTAALLDEYNEQVQILNLTTPSGQYHAVAGEIEAYDVQARRRRSAEERKNTRPNIDRKDAVVSERFDVSYFAKNEYDPEKAGIHDQIKNAQEKLNAMDVVFKANPPVKVGKAYEAGTWAISELKKYGFQADRQGFGKIYFTEDNIRHAMAYLDTDAEKVSIVALYKVLKQGIKIGEHGNHKLREKHTITLAAPVELNGIRGNMAVVVNMRNNQYKVHRILMPDGSIFKFGEIKNDAVRETQRGVPKRSLANATSPASTSSIPQKTDLSTPSTKKVSDGKASRELDTEYLSAVERGDMETAQRMVDEAAKKAGYTNDSSYQGSLAFNGAAPSSNGYFLTKEERKKAYDNGEFEGDYSFGDFVDNGLDGNDLEWQLNNHIAASGRDTATLASLRNLTNVAKQGKRTIKMYRAVDAKIKENSFRNGDWITPSREYAQRHIWLQDWSKGRIIEQEVSIDDIWWNGDDINEWGYDDGKNYGYKNTINNRKLLDAVTYDDNGNVIPLSERFNPQESDIRYSRELDVIDYMNEQAEREGREPAKPRSNREILANALESSAQHEVEKKRLAEYKAKIKDLDAEQENLKNLKAKIKKLTFGTQKKDPVKLKALREEAVKSENRIKYYDKKLLELEAMTAIKNVLEVEKRRSFKSAMSKAREIMHENVEGRYKTVERNKIKRVAHELEALLNRGTKERNVKKGIAPIVRSALDISNMLFATDDELLLSGIGTEYTDTEQAAMDEYMTLYEEYHSYDDAVMENKEKRKELRSEMNEVKKKFEGVLERERRRIASLKAKGAFDVLIEEYGKLANSDEGYIRQVFDADTLEHIKKLKQDVGETLIKDMTLDQLQKVYKAYRMVQKMVTNANKTFATDSKATIEELGDKAQKEIELHGEKGKKTIAATKGLKQLGWDNLKPVYLMERIGSKTLQNLFQGVLDAESQWARYTRDAQQYIAEQEEKYHYKDWDLKKTKKFTTPTGLEYKLTLGQMMTIYAYSKRGEQATEHLRNDGFVFDKIEVVEKGIKYELTDKTAYKISDSVLLEIVNGLSKDQKAYVDAMQEYLSDTLGKRGNEVSNKLYGIDLFNEENYLPIRSERAYLERARDKDKGTSKIKNRGFTKPTQKNASNAIVLEDFNKLCAEHIVEMNEYAAFTLPLEDFYRVYNYQNLSNESTDKKGVIPAIINAYGDVATKSLDRLLDDLNGSARSEYLEGMGKHAVSAFKKAKVMLSLSVVIQQPSSILRAQALIDPKYFVGKKLDKAGHKAAWEELKKYAPVAIIKEMGYFDVGMGRSTVDWLLGDKTVMDHVDEWTSKGAAYADEVAWISIWNAVKRETLHNNPTMSPTSEKFLNIAGKRFEDIIRKTQVYDSTLSRSANMRSKSLYMQMITSFMAEPTTSLNMREMALRSGDKARIARVTAAVYASALLNAVLVALPYAMRDEDEDETFAEKYLSALTSSFVDNINPITSIPFFKDIWSLATGYSVERQDMSLFSDLLSSTKKLVSIAIKEDNSKEEIVESWVDFIGNFANLTGIPVKNLYREIKSIVNTAKTLDRSGETTWNSVIDVIQETMRGEMPVVGWLPGESKTDKLYDAIIKGDKAYEDRIKSTYDTDAKYQNAVRKALKENDPRIEVAAQALIDGDYEEYGNLIDDIVAEGHFTKNDVKAAIESKRNSMDESEKEEKETVEKEESIFETEYYYNAIVSGDTEYAKEMRDDIINAHMANGMDKKDAEKSLQSSFSSHLKKMYISGNVSRADAKKLLVKYGGCDDNEAYWDIRKWDYVKENGSDEGYSMYNEFNEAVRTGKNLKNVINDYTSHGKSKDTLASQITSYYKPIYKKMTTRERANLKPYLLNAYALLGYDRDKKMKDIDKWLEG